MTSVGCLVQAECKIDADKDNTREDMLSIMLPWYFQSKYHQFAEENPSIDFIQKNSYGIILEEILNTGPSFNINWFRVFWFKEKVVFWVKGSFSGVKILQ